MAPPGAGRLSRAEYARAAFLLLVLLALIAAVVMGSAAIAAVALALAIAVTTVRAIESWPVLVTGLLLVIFLIPIKRYKLPGSLPFDVEPYRLMVMGLTLLWIAALLVDRRVRLRRTMLDVPLLVLLLSVLASVSANTGYLYGLGVTTDVIKAVSFFTSFLLVCFVLLTVVTERAHIERVIRVIVVLAALVSAAGVVEFHTGFNPFNHLSQVVPILHYEGDLDLTSLTRSDRLRVYASAQHPIALAGALAMILPLALYLAQSTQRRIWWAATFLVGLGALSTLSRTGVVALVVAGVTLLVLRPVDTRKILPLLAPAMVVVFFVLPNALGTFKSAFFPQGGIVAEQSGVVYGNELRSTGRLSDIGPSLQIWRKRPLFGEGYGSRIVELGPRQNAAVLDDQWLGALLETGLLGVAALVWVVARAVRRLGRIARRDSGSLGLLAGSLAASILSYAVSMVTYDAFGFIQVTMLFFVVLALAGATVALEPSDPGACVRRVPVAPPRPAS